MQSCSAFRRCPADKAEAAEQYKLAVQYQPNDAASLTRLGDIAGEAEDHATAIARYKQALAAQPQYADAQIGLAYELSETGHPDQAVPLLKDAISNDPMSMLAHFRLSAVYRRLHQPEDAKRELAEYEKLKAMKDNLRNIYDTMRLDSPQGKDVTSRRIWLSLLLLQLCLAVSVCAESERFERQTSRDRSSGRYHGFHRYSLRSSLES